MNFRFEDKLKLNHNKLLEFNEWILKNNIQEIFEPREIFSIYFDTKNFQAYHDSTEGLVPRTKLRLRTYNFKSLMENKFNIEIKKSVNYGRLKSSQKLVNIENALNYGIYMKNYGFCYPKIIIKYERIYYKLKNIRITLDKNVQFKNYSKFFEKGKFDQTCNLVVAEIKYSSKKELTNLFNELPFEITRFSKYCMGLETLNLL
tara:strand:- start:45 stop:653 length:609 start_codon:yes stop_codon:yes gene_type:complete